MLGLAVAVALMSPPNPDRYAGWGAEALERISRECYTTVYVEGPNGPPASLKSLNEVIAALAVATAYDAKYAPSLKVALDISKLYWNPIPPVAGFNSSSTLATADRSYADNALFSITLAQAANVLKSTDVATAAAGALQFAKSGAAKPAGEYDHEGDSSPLTARAGAATALATLAQSTGKPDQAVGLYEWVRQTFRDPATNLFKTSTNSAENDATDTALMIRVAAQLFAATNQAKYGEQARRLEASGMSEFGELDGRIKSSTAGAADLVEAWFARIRMAPGRGETFGATVPAFQAVEWFHKNGRDSGGHYAARWDQPARGKLSKWRLIDEAAAARVFFIAAAVLKAEKEG